MRLFAVFRLERVNGTPCEQLVLTTPDWNLALAKATQMRLHELPGVRVQDLHNHVRWCWEQDCSTYAPDVWRRVVDDERHVVRALVPWSEEERRERLIECAEEIMNLAIGVTLEPHRAVVVKGDDTLGVGVCGACGNNHALWNCDGTR